MHIGPLELGAGLNCTLSKDLWPRDSEPWTGSLIGSSTGKTLIQETSRSDLCDKGMIKVTKPNISRLTTYKSFPSVSQSAIDDFVCSTRSNRLYDTVSSLQNFEPGHHEPWTKLTSLNTWLGSGWTMFDRGNVFVHERNLNEHARKNMKGLRKFNIRRMFTFDPNLKSWFN